MSRFYYACVIALLLMGCSTSATKERADQLDSVSEESADEGPVSLGSYETTEVPDNVQTLTSACAVVVYPNEEQILQLQERLGDDFYTIADDYTFYQAMAGELLDSLQIKQEVSTGLHIRLQGSTHTWNLMVRGEDLPAWNLILFNPAKEPRIVSVADLNRQMAEAYFDLP